MAGTQLFDLTGTAIRLTGLGTSGDAASLVNVGNDFLEWSIGLSAPDGPGFRLGRAESATITLPEDARLWAWSAASSRLAVSPVDGSGIVPGNTARITVDATPIMLPSPPGLAAGGRFIVVNVGGQDVSGINVEDGGATPDGTVAGKTYEPGTVNWFTNAGDSNVWVWARRFGGSALLIQEADQAIWKI